ncbi:MAG: DUF4197 domain-containing protein [Saprospiraceae bacterium]|uniref:DUF4197 domain-containing protein n=1 Tax=Candidatus Opimibacter skivensis TaxID=2982028 RepID=A0A9D7SZQ4_9BACT|nr:DUF4197 domain-containing protein [Candidatus Opimibacter skivensis]
MQNRIIIFSLFFAVLLPSCDTLKQVLSEPTTAEIGSGLKQALEFGINEGANLLSQRDGYYKSAYKILLPEEARRVTNRLKVIPGFSDLENVIVEKLNHAAEDAAKSAAPIFVDAIKEMTFDDALNILLGSKDAATQYLHTKTYSPLYQKFQPVIVTSLNKFNAIQYWADAINAYNKIPLVEKVNPKLDEYVTDKALDGLFAMVAQKELVIRTDISSRTTDLLKKVFAKQDK